MATFTMPGGGVVVNAVFAGVPVVSSVWVRTPFDRELTSVLQGDNQTFTATVTGLNNPPQTVIWTLEGSESSGTSISATGVLTVAADETARFLTVRATSTFNLSVSGTAQVLVARPGVMHKITLYDSVYGHYFCCLGGMRSPMVWLTIPVQDGDSRFHTLVPPAPDAWCRNYEFAGFWRDMESGEHYYIHPEMQLTIYEPRTFGIMWHRSENWQPPIRHNIAVNVQGNGSASASVASAYANNWVTLTATPNAGSHFVEWQVVSGGAVLSSTTTASTFFTMPDNEVVVRAVFAASPTVTQVTVTDWMSSGSFIALPGNNHSFRANVIGTNNPPQTVTWSVTGNVSNNTFISSTGVLTVGADEPIGRLIVRATSTFNTSFSGTATVQVTCPTIKHSVTILMDADLCCHVRYDSQLNMYEVHDGQIWHHHHSYHELMFGEGVFIEAWRDMASGYRYHPWSNTLIQGPRIFMPMLMRRESILCCCGHTFYQYHMLTQLTYHHIVVNRHGNGTAFASQNFAPVGSEITLSASPAAGYNFVEWQVVSGDNEFQFTTTDAQVTFNMPNIDVHAQAIFAPVPSVTSVVVTKWHPDAVFQPGQSYRFWANVRGPINPPQTVTWTVEGNGSSGTFISDTGMLTIGIDETSQNMIVRATSTAVPSISGSVPVAIACLTTRHSVTLLYGLAICCCLDMIMSTHDVHDGYMWYFWDVHIPQHINMMQWYNGRVFSGMWRDVESGAYYRSGEALFIRGSRTFAPVWMEQCCCMPPPWWM